ncbi:anti-sigma 24 factor [Rhodocyclaceae bacterium]|nr:anti-sigma 24 factor [Rhodocyclaceae bacterium]
MKDKLSALLDGSLDEQCTAAVLDALKRDPAARRDWDTWCLIGDVLRGEHSAPRDFVSRVMAEIEHEPVLFAPAAMADSRATRSIWRSVMPLAASLMGVAAVGWVAHTLSTQDSKAGTLTASAAVAKPPVVASAGREAVSEPDPHRQYVFVHQAMSGGPLSGAVHYVRTVSEIQPETGR